MDKVQVAKEMKAVLVKVDDLIHDISLLSLRDKTIDTHEVSNKLVNFQIYLEKKLDDIAG